MNSLISIPANENGLVRLFALSMDDAEAKALRANKSGSDGQRPLERVLGCEDMNHAHVEVFAVADLGDMALTDYLIEGAGVLPATLEVDRTKLASLDGWVLVVYSSAFDGHAQEASPSPQLTLIGTYAQDQTDWGPQIDLRTPSALPVTSDQDNVAPTKRPSDAAMSGRIAMVALLVAFAVAGLMLWVGS